MPACLMPNYSMCHPINETDANSFQKSPALPKKSGALCVIGNYRVSAYRAFHLVSMSALCSMSQAVSRETQLMVSSAGRYLIS